MADAIKLGKGRIFFGTDHSGSEVDNFELAILEEGEALELMVKRDQTFKMTGTFVAGTEFKKFQMKLFKGAGLRVRHKATGEPAIAMRRPDGLLLVQFNWLKHPHAYGWHLYPRHHFKRRRGK